MGGGKSTVNTAADPAVGAAAMREAQLGEDWLNVSREQFAVANARQAGLDNISGQVAQQQLGASRQAQEWATQDRARSVGVFQPLQDDFIQRAKGWDSPDRQAAVATEAEADVRRAIATGDATRARQQGAMGVNPTSGRYAGVDRSAELAGALATAGAGNNARTAVRGQAMGLMGDAINLGSGLGVNPATALGLGSQLGTSAIGSTVVANQANMSNLGILQGGYSTAMQGYQAQAGILGQQRGQNIQLSGMQQAANSQNQSSTMGAIGSIAGMAVMAF